MPRLLPSQIFQGLYVSSPKDNTLLPRWCLSHHFHRRGPLRDVQWDRIHRTQQPPSVRAGGPISRRLEYGGLRFKSLLVFLMRGQRSSSLPLYFLSRGQRSSSISPCTSLLWAVYEDVVLAS